MYLPFGVDAGQGAAALLHFMVLPPSHAQSFEDGVLLSLAMQPDTEQTAEFNFSQRLTARQFRYEFSLDRGWSLPPNLVTIRVVVPPGTFRFSVPPLKHERLGDREIYTLPNTRGKALTIEWD